MKSHIQSKPQTIWSNYNLWSSIFWPNPCSLSLSLFQSVYPIVTMYCTLNRKSALPCQHTRHTATSANSCPQRRPKTLLFSFHHRLDLFILQEFGRNLNANLFELVDWLIPQHDVSRSDNPKLCMKESCLAVEASSRVCEGFSLAALLEMRRGEPNHNSLQLPTT